MDTRQVTREVRLTHWAGILRDRRDSGLSVRGYCLEQGINEKTYYYWQRKLRETACEGLIPQEHNFPASSHKGPTVFAALPMQSSNDSGHIVIRLNGAEVEIRGEANSATVDTVLRVLRGC